jgi:hypothetical protein
MSRLRSARLLLFFATCLSAILAGITVDRYFIQRPAFEHIGMIAWGEYGRHADLSCGGLVLYPSLAIGNAVFAIASAILLRSVQSVHRATMAVLYAGVGFAVLGLVFTTQAAPIMLGVAALGDNPQALRTAFEGFFFWSAIRGVCQILAFLANLMALTLSYPTPR